MTEEQVAELEGEVLPEENTGEAVEQEDSATSPPEETSAEPEKPKARGVQKRLDELTANWRGEQRRSDQLLQQVEALTKQLGTPPEQEAEPTKEPVLEDFSSYEEFVDARAAYRAEEVIAEKLQEIDNKRQEEAVSREQATIQQQFDTRAKAFAETHDDFQEVAFNPNLHVTEDMVGLLNVSEQGPEILYHLGQNPDESYRIAQLPPGQAAMELGRIEAQLNVLQPNKQTGAPDPIEPISDGRGSQSKDPDEMNPDEWLAWRTAQLESKA